MVRVVRFANFISFFLKSDENETIWSVFKKGRRGGGSSEPSEPHLDLALAQIVYL